MQSLAINLNKLSVAEKLQALDEIWGSLVRNTNQIPVPSWHLDVLAARQHSQDFISLEQCEKELEELFKNES